MSMLRAIGTFAFLEDFTSGERASSFRVQATIDSQRVMMSFTLASIPLSRPVLGLQFVS